MCCTLNKFCEYIWKVHFITEFPIPTKFNYTQMLDSKMLPNPYISIQCLVYFDIHILFLFLISTFPLTQRKVFHSMDSSFMHIFQFTIWAVEICNMIKHWTWRHLAINCLPSSHINNVSKPALKINHYVDKGIWQLSPS